MSLKRSKAAFCFQNQKTGLVFSFGFWFGLGFCFLIEAPQLHSFTKIEKKKSSISFLMSPVRTSGYLRWSHLFCWTKPTHHFLGQISSLSDHVSLITDVWLRLHASAVLGDKMFLGGSWCCATFLCEALRSVKTKWKYPAIPSMSPSTAAAWPDSKRLICTRWRACPPRPGRQRSYRGREETALSASLIWVHFG